MKTPRRSLIAVLLPAIAACFGLTRKTASATPSVPDADNTASPPKVGAGSDPGIATSPDGRMAICHNASGDVVRVDRFDDMGRLVSTTSYACPPPSSSCQIQR